MIFQMISSRGFGTIDKIFLEYEEAWWSDDCVGLQFVWTKDIPDFERLIPHTKCIDGTNEEVCVIIHFDILLPDNVFFSELIC